MQVNLTILVLSEPRSLVGPAVKLLVMASFFLLLLLFFLSFSLLQISAGDMNCHGHVMKFLDSVLPLEVPVISHFVGAKFLNTL